MQETRPGGLVAPHCWHTLPLMTLRIRLILDMVFPSCQVKSVRFRGRCCRYIPDRHAHRPP